MLTDAMKRLDAALGELTDELSLHNGVAEQVDQMRENEATYGVGPWYVWFKPTFQGRDTFGWDARCIAGPFAAYDDAEMECYVSQCENSASVDRDYFDHVVNNIAPGRR